MTVSFACEFLDAAREGELVEATGEITRAGGSLIFLRGLLKSGERSLFTFSGTIKRVKRKAADDSQPPLPPSLIQPLPQARRGWRDYALLLALACCWSSTYPLTKIGLGSIPPITFISARSLIAAALPAHHPARCAAFESRPTPRPGSCSRSSRPSIRRSRS